MCQKYVSQKKKKILHTYLKRKKGGNSYKSSDNVI